MTMSLTLVHQFPHAITLQAETGETLDVIDCGVPHPVFPVADGTVSRIDALDMLEHVSDEEAWLRECARVMSAGGTLVLRVPRRGLTGWWDALNIYRYARDIIGRGAKPREVEPVGWHRHYDLARDLRPLLARAGFAVADTRHTGLGLGEVPHLARLVVEDMIRGQRQAGQLAREAREPLDRLDAQLPTGPFARRLVVIATKSSGAEQTRFANPYMESG